MLKKSGTDSVYLFARSDGHLFNILRFRAKNKIRPVTIRDLLFADDAALVSHQQEVRFSETDGQVRRCFPDLFSLTISQKEPQIMGQATPSPPCLTIDPCMTKNAVVQ